MWALFKSWWAAKKAGWDTKVALTDQVRALMEKQNDIEEGWEAIVNRSMNDDVKMRANALAESANDEGGIIINTLNRNDGVGWEIIGSAYKGHVAQDQQVMIAQARRLCGGPPAQPLRAMLVGDPPGG